MDDDTRSKDLTLPEDEPWMSHGFISKIAAQVSLPYRRPKDGVKEIERRNGSLVEKRHLVLVGLISGLFLGLGGTLLTGTVCAFFHRGQRKVEMLGGLSP